MKSMKRLLATLALVVATTTAMAHPMSYATMRDNARFLTDRMVYTLGLSTSLIDDLYYINYDYICGVNDYLDDVALGYYYDDYMSVVRERDYALRRLLTAAQWNLLITYDYFFRPISFVDRAWHFAIHAFDRRHNHYYYHRPSHFHTYSGGRHFHGMRPGHKSSYIVAPHRGNPMGNGRPVGRPAAGNGRPVGKPAIGNGRPVGRPDIGNGGTHRPDGGKVDRPANNGGTNGRPSGTPSAGTGNHRPSNDNNGHSVRPDNTGGRNDGSVTGNTDRNRGDRVSGSDRGNRSNTNMRSSSRSGSRSSISTGHSSSGSRSSFSRGGGSSNSRSSSVSRSFGSSSRSAGATRGGGSGSSRGGHR